MLDNPNPPAEQGITPIYNAAGQGHTEIVKILVPLADNPNAPDDSGKTPIYCAAYGDGHTDIFRILFPLSDNPNAGDIYGNTPLSVTNNAEIRRILKEAEKSTKPSQQTDKKL